MNRLHRLLTPAVILLAGMSCGTALADEAVEARMRDQLRQTILQLRQAQDDNADLKAKLDAATQQVAAQPAPKKVDDAELQNLRRSLKSETEKTAKLQAQVDEDKKTLAQWHQGYDQTAALAKSRDAEAKKFEALYHDTDSLAKSCEEKNATLVDIGNELVERYKGKTVWDSVKDTEPLTGLHRVQLETLAQEYHGKIINATAKSAADAGQQQPSQQQQQSPPPPPPQ